MDFVFAITRIEGGNSYTTNRGEVLKCAKKVSRQEPKAFCLSDNSYEIAVIAAHLYLSF